jgi:hypothetical protein
MSAGEVIQMLDATVDWYRTLGIQQQIADEPSDLLSLSENRQIANQVLGLAFDVARASANTRGEAREAQLTGCFDTERDGGDARQAGRRAEKR